MKTPFVHKSILVVLALFVGLASCKEQDSVTTKNPTTPFFVKDENQQVVSKLHPQQIAIVHKDLVAKERLSDAENFLLTYDAKTGNVRSGIAIPTSSNARRAPDQLGLNWTFSSRNLGWQSSTIGPGGGIMLGVTGQHLRLEAIKAEYSSFPFPPPVPTNTDPNAQILYEAHVQYTGWQGAKSPGLVAGTVGQSQAIQAIRLDVRPYSVNRVVTYRAHVAGIGWMPWVGDEEVSGTIGQHRDMEAFEMMILLYPVG